MGKKRVLSGMRPTGAAHLGHLVGAFDNWVAMQDELECFYCIVDWHALTTDYANTSELRKNILELALDFLAVGLDPNRSTLFVQSHVPAHAELHLLLSMVVPLPWLERVPTYKEQIEQLREKDLNTYGFLGYPLLQSADILIYRADFVPVGEDQKPHVELTREIARRFNNFYGAVLSEPDVRLTPTPKLPGTDGRKMSKSYGNTINLGEEEKSVRQKLSGFFRRVEGSLQAVIQQGITCGSFRSDLDAAGAASHVVSAMEGMTLLARTYRSLDPWRRGIPHLLAGLGVERRITKKRG